jgi:N-acetylglutamate synthase-like GNAT family acetyltransferase
MVDIINVKKDEKGLREGIRYIHGVWGNAGNYAFYEDAIRNASETEMGLPQFYLLLDKGGIIGCAALLTNDFISRHDLYPWVGCLYVDEARRGKAYGRLLLEYAARCAKLAGFNRIYLTTDHDGYYEKYGWTRMEDGIDLFSGESSRIYFLEL